MMRLLTGVPLRYNENATDPGAQTERRGEAGPVSVLLRGWDSPAALFTPFYGSFFLILSSFTASARKPLDSSQSCRSFFSASWFSSIQATARSNDLRASSFWFSCQ